ncbi:MAG: oxidoreductase, partial [Panacagrimonas sp.]
MPSQTGRVAIVTGANSGLGLETSVALAAAGATVVMACRNPAKAKDALEQLRLRVPGANAALMTLDLANLASVRSFAADFDRTHARLDLLINNGGIMKTPLSRTVDGFESQFGTNHLGHFALTGLLMGRLLSTPGARVITICSLGHWRSKGLPFDDLGYERTPYSPFGGYCNSKLANLLFTVELARRLEARGASVIAASAHPGGAQTNISAASRTPFSAFYERLATPIALRWFINTAAIGALPGLYAATAPGVRNDDYYGPDRMWGLKGHPGKAKRSALSRDTDAAR